MDVSTVAGIAAGRDAAPPAILSSNGDQRGAVNGQPSGITLLDEFAFLPPATKSFLRSKTIWGLATLTTAFGWNVNVSDIGSVVSAFAALLGVILGVWGRVTARQPLHVFNPAPYPKMDDCGRPTGGTLPCLTAALCLLTAGALSGCGAHTTLYNPTTHQADLSVGSNVDLVDYQRAANGATKLKLVKVDNATPTTATGTAIVGGIKAAGANAAGVITAAGASKLFSPIIP